MLPDVDFQNTDVVCISSDVEVCGDSLIRSEKNRLSHCVTLFHGIHHFLSAILQPSDNPPTAAESWCTQLLITVSCAWWNTSFANDSHWVRDDLPPSQKEIQTPVQSRSTLISDLKSTLEYMVPYHLRQARYSRPNLACPQKWHAWFQMHLLIEHKSFLGLLVARHTTPMHCLPKPCRFRWLILRSSRLCPLHAETFTWLSSPGPYLSCTLL